MAVKIQVYFLRLTVIGLFITCLAFALFFANGYSYDFVSHEFRKTGGMDVIFADKKAQVYLDGVLLEGNLPFVASNILPGNYDLVVAKTGFLNWQKKIEIIPDIVKKIDDVVLFPANTDDYSKVLFTENSEGINYLFRENRVFKIAGKYLSFSRLSAEPISDWEKALVLPSDDLQDIIEQNSSTVVLNFVSGNRYFLDLNDSRLNQINAPIEFLPANNRWVYFKDGLVAFYNKDLTQVIWSGRFEKSIKHLEYASKDSLIDMLKIQFVDSDKWNVYFLHDNKLVKMADHLNDFPLYDIKDKLLVMPKGKEIVLKPFDWNLNSSEVLWQRFAENFKLIGFWSNTKSFIFEYQDVLMLADFNFANVYEIFKGQKILDLRMLNDGNLFYLKAIGDSKNSQVQLRLIEANKL